MPQGYFNPPSQGIQVGSAFMNSMMQSYNRALFMQADINRFKAQERRFAESTEFREEGRARSDFITYSNLVKQDIASSLFSDTADTQLAPEYRRRFIDRIGTPDLGRAGDADRGAAVTPDIDFVGPPIPPSLTRIGKARFQATTFKGEPAYKDTKTGQHFKRSPFKPGIKGIGAKFKADVPGIPEKDEAQAFKDIKALEQHRSEDKTLPPAVVEATRKRLRENESKVARDYLLQGDIESGTVTSLKDILGKFDQETKRTVLDDTISPEDARKGIDEYVDMLIDRGFTPAEALAKAEAEYNELVAGEGGFLRSLPQQASPATTRISRVGTETIPDPLGIR